MVQKRSWPWWLNKPAKLAVMVPLLWVWLMLTEVGWGWDLLVGLAVNLLVGYLWCAENTSRGYEPALRTLEAGDPNPWQLWRWMDIFGPTANRDHDEELYLRRLYVLRTPWFGIMLHWIKREDWDRDALHDHPWEFWRFIVSGGYTEELAYKKLKFVPAGEHPTYGPLSELVPSTELEPSKSVARRRWSFSKYPTGAFHRISSVKPRTVSLVINGPKTNSWGFFVPGTGKIGWRDYVDGAR